MTRDILLTVLRYHFDKQQMIARKTYNSNIYYLRFERKVMEILIRLYFRWIFFYKNVSRGVDRFLESLKKLRLLQIYTGIAELATFGHE